MTCAVVLAGLLAVLGAAPPEDGPHHPPAKSRDLGAPAVDLGAETATHEEVEPLPVKFDTLSSLCLHTSGLLLACDSGAKQVKAISPAGEVVKTVPLEFAPEAIDVAADGSVYCGGQGTVAHFDAAGNLLKKVAAPKNVKSEIPPRRAARAKTPPASEKAPSKPRPKRRARNRPVRISGIAVTKDHVFVAFGSGWSHGSKSKLFRFDRDLENPVLLAEGLHGCCQRCDVAAGEGVAYLAENNAYRVVAYDAAGKQLGKWGRQSRDKLEGFGSCCNPMNLALGADGTLYTAESGLGRVKRYTPGGEYLGLVGYVGVQRFTKSGGMAASCSNMAIAVTPDGGTVYVMDHKNNMIRVLKRKN